MTGRPNGSGNGNGRRGGEGGASGFPRWVRLMLEGHERRHDEHERLLAEMKADHEARMTQLERAHALHVNELNESRRQTREIVRLVSTMEKTQERIAASLSKIHGRVERLEETGRKG